MISFRVVRRSPPRLAGRRRVWFWHLAAGHMAGSSNKKEENMKGRFLRIGIALLVGAIEMFALRTALATVWFVSPSFPDEGGKGFSQDLLGEFGGEVAVTEAKIAQRWQPVRPDGEGYVDLLKCFVTTDDKVTYALATFDAKGPGIAWWRFGSDDRINVWVNGKAVYSFTARRSAQKDSDECLSRVIAGENTVLLKIDNGVSAWGFYFRLAETFPQTEGKSACIVTLTIPPYLLYGSKYPMEQWGMARVLNNGTETLGDATLGLFLNGETIGEAVLDGLTPDALQKCRVLLTAPDSATGGAAAGRAAVSVGGKELAPERQFEVDVREVHPLLSGEIEDADGALRFVHATDTHIVAEETVLNDVMTADNLKAAVEGINRIEPRPDFVMVTGDLVLDSAPGLEYFGELMKPLRMPWLMIPGNHDKPDGEEAVLRLFGKNGLPLYYSFDYAGYHIVALDGQPPSGSPVAGGLIPEEIEWLKRDLNLTKDMETVVFVHQHPLMTLIEKDARDRGLVDWPELVAVFESFPQVKWVFCGHAHVDYFAIRNGIRYIMTTATAYQFSPKEVPYFANEAGVRLMEFKDGRATSRFLRIDGTWREDPSIMDCPGFSLRVPESAGSTK
jgi:Icc protein